MEAYRPKSYFEGSLCVSRVITYVLDSTISPIAIKVREKEEGGGNRRRKVDCFLFLVSHSFFLCRWGYDNSLSPSKFSELDHLNEWGREGRKRSFLLEDSGKNYLAFWGFPREIPLSSGGIPTHIFSFLKNDHLLVPEILLDVLREST